jgi:hypothetical protein
MGAEFSTTMTELNSQPPATTRWAVPTSFTLAGAALSAAVHTEFPGAVLAGDLPDRGVHPNTAQGFGEQLPEVPEPAF